MAGIFTKKYIIKVFIGLWDCDWLGSSRKSLSYSRRLDLGETAFYHNYMTKVSLSRFFQDLLNKFLKLYKLS